MTTTNKKANIIAKVVIALIALAMLIPVGRKVCHAATTNNTTYVVNVKDGYLALRTKPSDSGKYEFGQLYKGEKVEVIKKATNNYWIVYSYKYNKRGYVNRNYLIPVRTTNNANQNAQNIKTVRVSSGFLALRNKMSNADSSIIQKLFNGAKVLVLRRQNATFWYVRDLASGKYGFVNRNYLV